MIEACEGVKNEERRIFKRHFKILFGSTFFFLGSFWEFPPPPKRQYAEVCLGAVNAALANRATEAAEAEAPSGAGPAEELTEICRKPPGSRADRQYS